MVEIHSWEDFKTIISFEDKDGTPIDACTMMFKFIYRDEAGMSYEVSYDGKTRVNCVCTDGQLFGIFNANSFRRGVLTCERHFASPDSDFADGEWNYGEKVETIIKIV